MDRAPQQFCRLALGTAQLGMRYGIANRLGMPNREGAEAIVKECAEQGILDFDTAQAYGDSEATLGACLRTLGLSDRARVITKIGPNVAPADRAGIHAQVRQSLARVGVPKFHGLLLHREAELDRWQDGWSGPLRELREQGCVGELGVSLYSVACAQKALDVPDMKILQVPFNVFDRRMLRSGVLRRADDQGVHVFVRSVFLQGLVVMNPVELEKNFPLGARAARALGEFCRARALEPAGFAFQYAMQRAPRTTIVFGAEQPGQVRENCAIAREAGPNADAFDAWDRTWPDDLDELVNPSLWPAS